MFFSRGFLIQLPNGRRTRLSLATRRSFSQGFLKQLPSTCRRRTRLSLATRSSVLLTSEYDFTLQTNTLIASDEIVLATHLQIRITLQTSMLISSDEHILFWGRTILALETNDLALETNTLELEMNTLDDRYSHSYLPLKRALSRRGDPKMCRCTTASSVALN